MRSSPRRHGVTSIDVLACLVILLLCSTFTLAQLALARETSNRIKCASNLKQIGLAMLLYSNENRGAYPRGRSDLNENPEPKPVWGTPYEGDEKLAPPDDEAFIAKPFLADEPKEPEDKPLVKYRPAFNDVTGALFLLLRTQDLTSDVFVCPSTDLEPFAYGGGNRSALGWTNWQGRKGLASHLSYSYQNPYPSAAAIGKGFKLNNSISAEFAIGSDMNPGGDALLKLKHEGNAKAAREGNSFNHNRDGQNILYGDGHVEFFNNPFAGVKRDNIYTYGKSGKEAADSGGEGIIGSPIDANDSILLPTARDIGQVDEKGQFLGAPKLEKATPQQISALREKLVGEYEQAADNGTAAKLSVTTDRITATSGPITITFTYAIDGLSGAEALLNLTAPQTEAETARIKIADDGNLIITKNQYYQGQWKRKN